MSVSTDSHHLLDCFAEFCALVDTEGRVVACNCQESAATERDRPPCCTQLALHPQCPCEQCYISSAFVSGEPAEGQEVHPDLGPLRIRVVPLIDTDGRSTLATLQISHSPQQTCDGHSARSAAQAFDSLPQTVFEADILGNITFANRHSLEKFEYTSEDIANGLNIIEVIAPEDRERLLQLFYGVLQGEQGLSAEFRAQTQSGGHFFALVFATPLSKNGQVIGTRGMVIDISPQKKVEHSLRENEQRYQHLAHHDQLTNLPNRTLLLERLSEALERAELRGKPLAVMVLDIDRFKQVNGSLGNDCSDQVVCEIARRLRKLLRQSDILARLNGDEFALVYSGVSTPDHLPLLAQRLLDAFQQPVQIGEHAIYLTASIGIASFQVGLEEGETLLRQAAIAMTEAKEQGGNCYTYFSREMQTRREEAFLLEKHMREALHRREFFLHYQPQIDLASGAITGVEALVRWAGPDGVLSSPESFIKVAEESGLIHPLGDFILREACAQNLRWQQSGLPPIQVTVNISARQFAQPGFVEQVLKTLAVTGLSPEWLELEITESAIMANIKDAQETMHCLQQAGVRFAIDDFGTGHSSLNYLRQLPLSKLKIDRSFMFDVPGNSDNEKLVFSILTLARSFNMHTVAEGIETQSQLAYLQQLDCDLGQGYLFSRPVAPEAIPALLSAKLP